MSFDEVVVAEDESKKLLLLAFRHVEQEHDNLVKGILEEDGVLSACARGNDKASEQFSALYTAYLASYTEHMRAIASAFRHKQELNVLKNQANQAQLVNLQHKDEINAGLRRELRLKRKILKLTRRRRLTRR